MTTMMSRVNILKSQEQIEPTILNNEFQNIVNTYNRNILNSNAIFINVKDYGATGNGVTDDGPSISTAYSVVVNAGGGIIYIPSGTYLVTSTQIVPASNTKIMGAGQRSTIINWNGSGYWLDDTSNGTIKTAFTLEGMSVNVNSATGKGVARIGDPTVTVFQENNQHIEYCFRDILATGKTGAIVTNSAGLQLSTFIRTTIEDCLFFDFDVGWDLKKFDVGYVKHNRIQRFTTYAIQFHNDQTGGGAQVADETVFINNEVLEIPATSTATIYLKQPQNVRFIGTYMEPKSGDSIPIAWSTDSAYNITILGGTVSKCTQIFNLKDTRNITIQNIGLQNPEISPAPTSTVTFKYNGSTDLSGTGGPFNNPDYGLIKVIDCAYLVMKSFQGIPGVTLVGTNLYGAGNSNFGGTIPDTSMLYATQILDRNGSAGLIKETGLVLSPFSSNVNLAGSTPQSTTIVADATATTGYALKTPANGGAVFMDIVYPTDIIPGSYEIVARIRNGTAIAAASYTLYYDGLLKENYGGINTTTAYKIINLRFNFAPANNPSTVSFRMDSTQDLYIDYVVIRPCINSLAIQAYSAPDLTGVGTATTPGYKVIYSSAAPVAGNWARGDVTINTTPSTGGNAGWICTASGAPGTWKVFGPIGFSLSASLAVVTASDSSLANSTTTTTELGYVHGVTSAIQTQLDAKQSTTLTSAHLFVGNGSNVSTDTAITGDVTISNAGVTTLASSVASTHTFSGQLIGKGTATNDSASTGYIGEYLSASASGVAMSNNTYVNVTSISLTAGDWDLDGMIQSDATGVVTRFLGAVSAYSGNTTTDHTGGDNVMDGFLPTAGSNGSTVIAGWRVSIASTTTIYLKARLSFGSGSPTATGRISARRPR